MTLKKDFTVNVLYRIFLLLILSIIASIFGACNFTENKNECGSSFFAPNIDESTNVLDKHQKSIIYVKSNFSNKLIETENESILHTESIVSGRNAQNTFPYKKEDISINMMWLNKDKVGSFTHKVNGIESIDILLPFPEISVTGKELNRNDLQVLNVIKGWNQKGWKPIFWIDSENTDKAEVYEKSLNILEKNLGISFILRDIQTLEFVKEYKNWIDKMPIYPKVDLCRMLAMIEGKGMQVYVDLVVYPMDLEELFSNGTSRLTNYLDKKRILMTPEIGEIVDKIKILDLERDIVFEKYEKIQCALQFSKKGKEELQSKMNEFRIERDCIDAKISEYNEFLKKDKSIEMYLDIQREIKEYLDIDVCKILNEKGFIMAKTVVKHDDEYRIGMFNENSFIMINTENQKAMCGLKKVFHEGALIILEYVNNVNFG